MEKLEIRDLCFNLIKCDLMPGSMSRIVPDDLKTMSDSLEFDYVKDKFPCRSGDLGLGLDHANLLYSIVYFYLQPFQESAGTRPKVLYQTIAGMASYVLLDRSLKLLSPDHFGVDGNKGFCLIKGASVSGQKRKIGEAISSIGDLFKIYKDNYHGELHDLLVDLDNEWFIKEKELPKTQSRKDPKYLFEALAQYRNLALHTGWSNGGMDYMTILLVLMIYTHQNN